MENIIETLIENSFQLKEEERKKGKLKDFKVSRLAGNCFFMTSLFYSSSHPAKPMLPLPSPQPSCKKRENRSVYTHRWGKLADPAGALLGDGASSQRLPCKYSAYDLLTKPTWKKVVSVKY